MTDTRITQCFDFEDSPETCFVELGTPALLEFWDILQAEREVYHSLEFTSISDEMLTRASRLVRRAMDDENIRDPRPYPMREFIDTAALSPDRGVEKPAKYIAKILKKKYGYKLPAQVKSELGEILALPKTKHIKIRFSLGCNGNAEDYYHEDSCFWGSEVEARDYIEYNGGGAIRLYDTADNLIGRAWFLPYTDPTFKNGFVMFNFYGQDFNYRRRWADVISTVLGAAAKPVDTRIHSVYQNSHTTVFVGDFDPDSHDDYILSLRPKTPGDFIYANEGKVTCDRCHEHVDSENMYYSEYADQSICDDCRFGHYTTVSHGIHAHDILPDDMVTEIYHDNTLETYYVNDPVVVDIDDTYYHIDDTVVDEHGNMYPIDGDSWVQIDSGEIYPREDCTLNDDERWVHND